MGVIFKLHIPGGDYVYLDAVFSVGVTSLPFWDFFTKIIKHASQYKSHINLN